VLDWKDRSVSVRQETSYPDQGATKLTFTCKSPTDLTVNLRRPWWATSAYTVTINGKKENTTAAAGSYVALKRTWKSGDVVQIDMPMTFRMEGFKDNPKRAALMYGPLVMVAITTADDRTSALVTEDQKFLDALKPVPGHPLEFTAPSAVFRLSSTASSQPVTIKPLVRVFDESYAVYWDQYTPAEFAQLAPATDTSPR
jgi:hypothetical protein